MTNEYPNCVVWVEIPVSDLKRAKTFYETVLKAQLKDDNTGPNPMVMLPYPGGSSVSGHLYPGTPAKKGTGNTRSWKSPPAGIVHAPIHGKGLPSQGGKHARWAVTAPFASAVSAES